MKRRYLDMLKSGKFQKHADSVLTKPTEPSFGSFVGTPDGHFQENLSSKAANDTTPPTSCRTCAHRTAKGACGEPVLSGLAPHFQIVWHDTGGMDCNAWTLKPSLLSAESDSVTLLQAVKRMADFYDYDTEERAHALADCQINPQVWREIVQASRARWHWTLHGNERHPYLPTKETNP